MTSNSSHTTRATTDALQEAGFDPSARQVDRSGYSYVDFQAAIEGKPDPDDPCNEAIARLARQGRSEALRCVYREGYEGASRSLDAVKRVSSEAHRKEIDANRAKLCEKAGLARAQDEFPDEFPPREGGPTRVVRAGATVTVCFTAA